MVSRLLHLEVSLEQGLLSFRDRPNVRDVRVKGAVGVVEMEPGAAPSSDDFGARGAFIRPLRLPGADVVDLMPPLVIGEGDLGVLFRAIDGALPR